jgi:hypothetical protein
MMLNRWSHWGIKGRFVQLFADGAVFFVGGEESKVYAEFGGLTKQL